MFGSVLRNISYGMYAVGVMDGTRPCGCIVNTVSQITSDNPLVAVSVNKNNYTSNLIIKEKVFSVTVLSENVSPAVIGTFGYKSSRDTDKFSEVGYKLLSGAPYLTEDSCGTLVLKLESVFDAGTHNVFFARVIDSCDGSSISDPMTYSYFHRVVKGKAPKNAPTYQAEEPKAEVPVYVCKICGYEYSGDFSKAPDDYVCPICGASKDAFVPKQ